MNTIEKKYKGNFDAWAAAVQIQHAAGPRRLDAFLAKPTLKVLEKDLGFQAAESA
jgi:hypothetical protein